MKGRYVGVREHGIDPWDTILGVRGLARAAVLVGPPIREVSGEDVEDTGRFVVQHMWSRRSRHDQVEVRGVEKDGPALREGSDHQVLDLLNVVAGCLIPIYDLVEGEEAVVFGCGEASRDLRGKNVVVRAMKSQLLHGFQVNLDNDRTMSARCRGLPARR